MSTKTGDVLGGFELERKIGVGGMATVWLAHPITPRAAFGRVVLKQMHPHLAEHRVVRELFVEEARLARTLEHPNIVRVVECGTTDGECFIAMEYVDGVDLRSAMRAHGGPVWPALAASLVADACKGLHYAHQRGVIHRDISPDNIMVDRKGRVRLVDFGVARAESTELTTKTGLRKGKVRYMAPEYLAKHVATAATDVYSLGLTLHELLTGQIPFGDVIATTGVYEAIISRGLVRADKLRPSLPAQLVDLVAYATARKASERLQSAALLERGLRTFLEDFLPPSAEEIGDEVAVWKQKNAAGPLRERPRNAGSFGQLESTEFVKLADLDAFAQLDAAQGAPSVLVAHALDLTQVDWPLDESGDERTDPAARVDLDTDPLAPASVVLSADLEAAAQRHRGPKRKKKKKGALRRK